MFGVDTEILNRPFSAPLPVCEYSITPLVPDTNKGGLAAMISGSRSQLVEPGVRHWHEVALVVVHCAKPVKGKQRAAKNNNRLSMGLCVRGG